MAKLNYRERTFWRLASKLGVSNDQLLGIYLNAVIQRDCDLIAMLDAWREAKGGD